MDCIYACGGLPSDELHAIAIDEERRFLNARFELVFGFEQRALRGDEAEHQDILRDEAQLLDGNPLTRDELAAAETAMTALR